MTEPFVFHFTPGAGGCPEVMYILDLDCRCGLCRHEQFQRFYHSTPFHELTIPGLERLVDNGTLKAGYRCENCGEAVGASDVRNVCLIYGFSDDAGVIRIFDDLETGRRRHELTGHRRLDPQTVPRWSADADAFSSDHRVIDRLDESTVEEMFDRPFNVKLAWRDLTTEWLAGDRHGATTVRIGPHLRAIVAADEGAVSGETADDWELIGLDETDPLNLVDHRDPTQLCGRWRRWLPDEVTRAVDAGDIWIGARISKTPVVDVIERTFATGRLDVERRDVDGDIVFTDIVTPTDVASDREVSVASVLRRAVYTGLTPGEAARLSAEELVGRLMDVW